MIAKGNNLKIFKFSEHLILHNGRQMPFHFLGVTQDNQVMQNTQMRAINEVTQINTPKLIYNFSWVTSASASKSESERAGSWSSRQVSFKYKFVHEFVNFRKKAVKNELSEIAERMVKCNKNNVWKYRAFRMILNQNKRWECHLRTKMSTDWFTVSFRPKFSRKGVTHRERYCEFSINSDIHPEQGVDIFAILRPCRIKARRGESTTRKPGLKLESI